MNDAPMPEPQATRRSFVIPGLLLVLPLVIGARECERQVDDECRGDDCGSNGEAGQGAGGGPGGGGGQPAAGQGSGGAGGGGGDGCFYAGERRDVGDSFPSDDGCNTCTCTAGGQVACTLRACANLCGGLTGLQCAAGEYCNFPQDAQCGAADRTGTCETKPEVCTDQYDPVCGCDDATYGNACEAAANGVSVAHEGACGGGAGGGGVGGGGEAGAGGSGQTCGGIASLECADPDEFCNYEPSAGGQGCDGSVSDAGGVCQTRPEICTLQFDPVCGCDRRTYDNACAAHSASASVLHDGLCTEIDCAAVGGRAVDGFGPGPMCAQGEVDYGPIQYSNGMIAIEGTTCCVPQ